MSRGVVPRGHGQKRSSGSDMSSGRVAVARPSSIGHRLSLALRTPARRSVSPTVVIKIILTNGLAIEIEKSAGEAKSFAERVATDGYFDPVTGKFHPPRSILRVEVAPPRQFGEGRFSEN